MFLLNKYISSFLIKKTNIFNKLKNINLMLANVFNIGLSSFLKIKKYNNVKEKSFLLELVTSSRKLKIKEIWLFFYLINMRKLIENFIFKNEIIYVFIKLAYKKDFSKCFLNAIFIYISLNLKYASLIKIKII